MAETPIDPAAAGADPAASASAPQLGIEAQYIKDLSFENPLGPNAAAALRKQPQVEVDLSTAARELSEGRYEVTLVVRGQAKVENSAVFIAELTYGGVFVLTNVPSNAVKPILLIEGPRMLFPFARNIVAEITRDGGFPPLLINPIDFVQLYREQHLAEGETDLFGEG
jgi:preprotein translocase subunit SecB